MQYRRGIERMYVCLGISFTAASTQDTVFVPLHCLRSLLSLAKADSNGLSCMLCPFLPRRPHLLATACSSVLGACRGGARAPFSFLGVDSLRVGGGDLSISSLEAVLPPRMAETEE